MSIIRWIQATYLRTTALLLLVYLLATLVAVAATRAGGPAAGPVAYGAMGAALLLTAFLVRSPAFPRWSLVAAASSLAVGTPLVATLTGDPRNLFAGPAGMSGYGWIYLWSVAGTPMSNSRWCGSPVTVIAGALILVATTWVTGRL